MPYQNDMMSLADVVSPAYAAQQAGIQNDAVNQEEQARAQVAQATVPAEIQKPYLANLFSAAQTAGQQGIAQQEQAKGQVAQSLMPGTIAVGQAGNEAKLTGAHLEQMNQLGQMVGQIAGVMDQVPPPARPAMMQQILDQNNVTDPAIRQAVGSGDPDQLRSISSNLFATSQQARQSALELGMRGQTAMNVAQISSEGRVEAAQIRATEAERVQQLRNQTVQLKQTTDQRIAQLSSMPQTPDVANQLKGLQAYSIQLKQAQAGLNAQLLQLQGPGAMYMPTDTGGAPQAPQQGQQPQQQGTGPTMEQAAKQIWPNDDPTKYDYRMGPDGNLYRKPK